MKTYQLTDQEADLIVSALAELPYKLAFGVIQKIKGQYQEQIKPVQKPEEPKKV